MNDTDYYRAFLRGLWDEDDAGADPLVASLLEQPAFAIYRNTIFKGCVDALAANYPAVLRLVGDAWFQGAALSYARQHMPQEASLIAYGDGFPGFLTELAGAARLPYLSGVAALDRCWSESHLAADDAPINVAALHAALAAGQDVHLVPHAAAHWCWDPMHPMYSIWVANRRDGGDAEAVVPADLVWLGEGALLTRPDGQVLYRSVSDATCRFLDACRAGTSVAGAAGLALEADPGLDIASMLGELLQAGTFTSFH